ncbi:hypothetical protein [Streptomyces glebosus]|uniref:hypothetical protein n=1 Tax=Streptomyces glebosus TaxID=249580 RepID=UPI00167F0053|nr:hypothetical protein [Streptomyces glebosus]
MSRPTSVAALTICRQVVVARYQPFSGTPITPALEISVDLALDAAVPGIAGTTMRAKMLCLRCYTAAETARRTNAVWSHLCLGCHYHQYEIGPTQDQVRIWQAEVGELVGALATNTP